MSIIGSLITDLFRSEDRHSPVKIDNDRTQGVEAAISIQDRYLSLLVDCLLNAIYLENEVRFLYIFSNIVANRPIDPEAVRQIASRMPEMYESVRARRDDGRIWWRLSVPNDDGSVAEVDLRNVCQFSHTMVGRRRLQNVLSCLDTIRLEMVPGDLAEAGAWRGGASILMRGYLGAWDVRDKTVWVADSFEGLPRPSMPEDSGHDFSAEREPILAVSLEEVQENFRRYGLLDGQVRFLKGWFRDTLVSAPIGQLALLRVDGDLYESTMDALDALYDKVVAGGFVIIDDYGDFEPCRRAVDEFRERKGISDRIETIDWSGSYWRKSTSKV
ncbi:MAG: class I SAM-dependent methyltransferase [Burkholderiales bacterium]|nr:class I SAM-dependent methyltransferase [Burkholderiales bacterium]